MFKVGVTGGIGSGKTTVTNLFQQQGVTVVDADVIAREVVEPDTPALDEIHRRYGDDILLPNGNLNRARLRTVVFEEPSEKQWLEALLHPEIIQRCRTRLEAADGPYAILSSPLLIESGQFKIVDRVLVVDLAEHLQLERTAARDDTTVERVQQIIENQIGREERLACADDIIDNSNDELRLRGEVEQLHAKYLILASG